MSLCPTCASITLNPGERYPGGRLPHPQTILGPFTEIRTRATNGCPGCDFFHQTLVASDSWGHRLEELETRVVALDSLRLDCRKPDKVDWGSYSADDMLLDVCVAEDYEDAKDEEPIDRDEIDVKRPVCVSLMDDGAVNQLKSWIRTCKEHENCSSSHAATLPQRIMRLSPDSTVEVCYSSSTAAEYVALSYCAGEVELPRFGKLPTKLDVSSLPSTLADAITFTRRLGYEYLWIPSLCDEHNIENDLETDATDLVNAYGNAAITLVVAEGQDANAGIFHERHVLYSPPLGENRDKYLRLKLLRWDWDIERSTLARQARAKIERMIAPRVVHITRRQMIWECATGFQFEAAGIPDKVTGSGQIRQTYRKSLVQQFINLSLGIHRLQEIPLGRMDVTMRETLRREAWFVCVDEFSKATPSRPEDKLLAMMPIARMFVNYRSGHYLAGVWAKDIAFGLAWSRVAALLTSSPIYRAPTWSWASADGPISSLATAWPRDMMEEHAKDPSWLNKYEPKLISHEMILADQGCSYGSVLPGSHIIVSAMCTGLKKLAETLGHESGFVLNFGMDTSPVFDCPCCLPRPDEEQDKASKHFEAEADHHMCMVVMGDAWRVTEKWDQFRGFCDLIILKACKEANTYERVGFARVQKESFGAAKTIPETHKIWDSLDWDRRELKLI